MTFHVSNLLTDSRTLDVGGATIVYNPQALTVADYEQLDPATEGGNRWEHLVTVLSRMVLTWDLVDDEGPIPVTPEAIRRLPMFVLDKIMTAIEQDSAPASAEGEALGGASPSQVSGSEQPLQTSLNGGDSSSQPGTSASPPGISPASRTAG